MGNFFAPTSKMTSEERFAMSQRSSSSTVTGSGILFGGLGPITLTNSQDGLAIGKRTRAKRGKASNLEPVAPLEASANRWTRKSPVDGEQKVERKVRALLNKLTIEKFDSISDQIIEWANKSEAEEDGRTLIQITRLIFESAVCEAAWSEMYARLCRKMMDGISPNVRDDRVRHANGKPITGAQLFRKYLLNHYQEAVETSGEVELYSDEYYATQKAKRQGSHLIQSIGELYKLRMLTERIMHEWIKKLLINVDNPGKDKIESLCRLLTTVGKLLDGPKARVHMDAYFAKVKELWKSSNVAPRMQFMMQVSSTACVRQ
jgi:translation initiation factor 4G